MPPAAPSSHRLRLVRTAPPWGRHSTTFPCTRAGSSVLRAQRSARAGSAPGAAAAVPAMTGRVGTPGVAVIPGAVITGPPAPAETVTVEANVVPSPDAPAVMIHGAMAGWSM